MKPSSVARVCKSPPSSAWIAAQWREGRLPGPGGVQDQAAFTQAAIDIIHATWSKLEAWRRDKDKD